MNILKSFLPVFLSLFIILHIASCKKNSDDVSTEFDKYIIEMTSDYKFEKVTHIIANNVVDFEKTYEYSTNLVKVKLSNSLVYTYFLNQNGLADSSFTGTSINYYHYNQDNYLASCSFTDGTSIKYGYENGNRITYNWGMNAKSYEYNSQTSIIDINSFEGAYLGKLNKNLLQSLDEVFTMVSTRCVTTFNYSLNSSGLVIKRTSLTTFYSGEPQKKTVSEFEYVISN